MSTTTPTTSSPSSPIVVHHLNDSRSQRVLWILEELEIPYEIKRYQRTPQLRAPKELREIHPLGKSPIITDGNVTLAESGAIIEYLIVKYGNGRAQPLPEGYIDNLYYTHYSEGTFMPLASWKLILSVVPEQGPMLLKPMARAVCNGIVNVLINPQLKENMKMIDGHLQKVKGKWIAGGDEPTSADFMMLFAVEAIGSRVDGVGAVPQSIKDYVDMIHSRPAYKRALEKGGPYKYA